MINNLQALAAGTLLQSSTHTYTIERMLGQGGFGITYLASATVIVDNVAVEQKVCIKELFINTISERVAGSAEIRVMSHMTDRAIASRKDFLAEAKRLQMIGGKSAGVVNVSEVFEANNTAYYAMEFLNGQSLEQYIRAKGRLSADETRTLLGPVAEALSLLHANRITHLDVKPDNIMLTQEDDGTLRPVLIDFGLSKHYDAKGNATSTINTMGFSEGYSPIEQYAGIRTFSPASDVYAFAATMYHALTGKRPPAAHDVVTTDIAAKLEEAHAPADMRHFIEAAMVSSRPSRPPMWLSNEKYPAMKVGADTRVITSPKRPRRNLRPLIAGGAALLLAVLAIFVFGKPRVEGGMKLTLEIDKGQLLTKMSGNYRGTAFLDAIDATDSIYLHEGTSAFDYVGTFIREYRKLAPDGDLTNVFPHYVTTNNSDYNIAEILRSAIQDIASTQVVNVIRNRLEPVCPVAPKIAMVEGVQGQIHIELPGVNDFQRVKDILTTSGNLEFYEVYFTDELDNDYFELLKSAMPGEYRDKLHASDSPIALARVKQDDLPDVRMFFEVNDPVMPAYIKPAWSAKGMADADGEVYYDLYLLKPYMVMTGEYITDASVDLDNLNGPSIFMQMNSEGAKEWRSFTTQNIGRPIAMVIDGTEVLSAPMVNQAIENGRSQISGNFTRQEAEDLANVLRVGALPARLNIFSYERM